MGKYWGYKHTSGTLHVKSYVEPYSADSVADARESPNCATVIEPFEAGDIAAARTKLGRLVDEAEA